jgi:hypothetical protein
MSRYTGTCACITYSELLGQVGRSAWIRACLVRSARCRVPES